MFILSAGMQKAGTGYAYNLIHDLVSKTVGTNSSSIKNYSLIKNHLKWENNAIGSNLNLNLLLRLWITSLMYKPFVVKTHGRPSVWLHKMTKLGMIKLIYIYRDPRDVLVSVLDHGEKIRMKGGAHTFAKWDTFDKAFKRIKLYISVWKKYNKFENILIVKYEDLIKDPLSTMLRIKDFMKIQIKSDEIQKIIDVYDDKSKSSILHLNKGVSGRYLEKMTPSQIKSINTECRDTLLQMGYSVDNF